MKSFLSLIRKQTALTALVLFLLLAMSELASSQLVQEDPNKTYNNEDRLRFIIKVLVIAGVIAIILVIAFFTFLYLRQCPEAVATIGAGRATNATLSRSLHTSMMEAFPTFVYSEVKTQKIGKGALECVICLNEFEDDETLCLLPKCDHVFHTHCIAAWLHENMTCPICRMNLADQQETAETVEAGVITETDIESQQTVIPEPAVQSVAP